MKSTKMLVTTCYNDYWEKYGERFNQACAALEEKPDRILIVSDRPVNTPYENHVYVPDNHPAEYLLGAYRQKALELCDCDWLIQIDIDDIMYPNYCSNINDDCDWHIFNMKNNMHTLIKHSIDNFYTIQSRGISFGGYSNSAFRTSMLRKFGGYKTDFGWEDMIVACDLVHNKARAYIDESPIRGERIHDNPGTITKGNAEVRTQKANETYAYIDKLRAS